MDRQHSSSCGRRLAQEVEMAGGAKHDAVMAINRHCNVSLLRAHRIAYGYTLVEVTVLLKKILRERKVSCEGLAHQTVSRWETGLDNPSERYFDGLCYLYKTRPDRLGFGYDYSVPAPAVNSSATRQNSYVSNFVAISSFPDGAADIPWGSARLHGWSALRAVEALEQRAEQSGYELYTTSPMDFVPARMIDLAGIQRLLLQSQSSDVARRLNRAAAKNAGFIGIRLTDVASVQETFNWFSIARQAARRAQDAGIEAWIAGHMCDGYACYGFSLRQGLDAARVAQLANGTRPNSAALFGYLAEAGVQARLGRRRETLDAVRRAEKIYEALPPNMIAADGIRIPEYFLRWHQSNALSIIGEGRLADPLRKRALELPLGKNDVVGRGLLHLDEASLLFCSGDLGEACRLVKKVWDEVPDEFYVGQIAGRTTTILQGLKPVQEMSPEFRSLKEYLRLLR